MKIKTYAQALERVFVIEETRDYTLTKVIEWMELLWNPLKNIKVIHIAGTNGKGSTSKMCFAVLKHAWKKVGAFTQPHLLDIKERFLTDTWEITEEEFVELLNRILELDLDFSFFEKAFLLSCLLFEKRWVEFAIMEVWFGGLLDSTNVVSPIITAITSIWIDHTKVLWNTIEEISFQKAGIIKEGIPIVYNHQNKVIEKIAQQKDAPIIFTEKLIETNLIWEYQKKNAAIAFEICKYILNEINSPLQRGARGGEVKNIILQWLEKVQHFGRLQYITDNLLIDWAHNEQWLEELKKYILWLKNKNIRLCFAQKKGKDGSKIMKVFWKEYNNFILVKSSNTLMVEDAASLKEKIINNFSVSTESQAWDSSLNIGIHTPEKIFEFSQKNKQILYVVFGSLYMIGEFLEFKN